MFSSAMDQKAYNQRYQDLLREAEKERRVRRINAKHSACPETCDCRCAQQGC
jgi:hypothetical protein